MTTEMPQTPEQASSAQREGAPAGTAARHPGQPAARDEGAAPRPAGAGPAAGGPRGPRRDGGPRPFGPPGMRRPRRKVCVFCVDKVKRIDYKDRPRLQRFMSDRARIDPRRKSGNCAKHQRMLTTALKRARYMALLPYTADHVRAMMSTRDRAIAGGPPPARPERAPFRPPYAPRSEGATPAPRPETATPAPPAPRPESATPAPRPEPRAEGTAPGTS